MAAAHILTGGYGNGSLSGSPSLVLSLGYSLGEVATARHTCGNVVIQPAYRGMAGIEPAYEGSAVIQPAYRGKAEVHKC